MDDDYRKYGNSRAAHFEIDDPHKCFVCGAFVADEAIECPKCHFPQNGDEISQRRFLGELRVEKRYEGLAAYRVGYVFHFLLLMPLYIFVAAFSRWEAGQILQAQIIGLFGIAFFLIWFFGRKSPFRAFALSLVLYTILTAPIIIYEPWIILKLRFLPIVPYVLLPIGIFSFKDWKELNDDLAGKNSG